MRRGAAYVLKLDSLTPGCPQTFSLANSHMSLTVLSTLEMVGVRVSREAKRATLPLRVCIPEFTGMHTHTWSEKACAGEFTADQCVGL